MADNFWKFLSSTRLALTLLIILTVVSVVGIVIPQDLPPERYLANLGPFFGKIVLLLSLRHIFSAPWFYALLGMLSLNLIACIITRLWKSFQRTLSISLLASESELMALRHFHSFSVNVALVSAQERVLALLRKKGFRVLSDSGAHQIAAKKGLLKEIGSLVFHFSILFLFVGGLVGKFGGYSIMQELRDHEVKPVPERGFLVRSDWFKVETNEKGEVKDYKSQLSLLRPDSSVIVTKVIEVNDPLTLEGIRFYQASFGRESEAIVSAQLRITGVGNDSYAYEGAFAFDRTQSLPGTQWTVRVARFLGDFAMDNELRRPTLRSNEHENPAVLLVFTGPGGEIIEQWGFLNYPEAHQPKGIYQAEFIGYTPSQYTGIQIKYNPGSPLIWVGILLMTFGILAMFYVSKPSLWVMFKDNNNNSTLVSVGGLSNRVPSSFQKAFEDICASIRAGVEEGGH